MKIQKNSRTIQMLDPKTGSPMQTFPSIAIAARWLTVTYPQKIKGVQKTVESKIRNALKNPTYITYDVARWEYAATPDVHHTPQFIAIDKKVKTALAQGDDAALPVQYCKGCRQIRPSKTTQGSCDFCKKRAIENRIHSRAIAPKCPATIRKGPRSGEVCGAIADANGFCKHHIPSSQATTQTPTQAAIPSMPTIPSQHPATASSPVIVSTVALPAATSVVPVQSAVPPTISSTIKTFIPPRTAETEKTQTELTNNLEVISESTPPPLNQPGPASNKSTEKRPILPILPRRTTTGNSSNTPKIILPSPIKLEPQPARLLPEIKIKPTQKTRKGTYLPLTTEEIAKVESLDLIADADLINSKLLQNMAIQKRREQTRIRQKRYLERKKMEMGTEEFNRRNREAVAKHKEKHAH